MTGMKWEHQLICLLFVLIIILSPFAAAHPADAVETTDAGALAPDTDEGGAAGPREATAPPGGGDRVEHGVHSDTSPPTSDCTRAESGDAATFAGAPAGNRQLRYSPTGTRAPHSRAGPDVHPLDWTADNDIQKNIKVNITFLINNTGDQNTTNKVAVKWSVINYWGNCIHNDTKSVVGNITAGGTGHVNFTWTPPEATLATFTWNVTMAGDANPGNNVWQHEQWIAVMTDHANYGENNGDWTKKQSPWHITDTIDGDTPYASQHSSPDAWHCGTNGTPDSYATSLNSALTSIPVNFTELYYNETDHNYTGPGSWVWSGNKCDHFAEHAWLMYQWRGECTGGVTPPEHYRVEITDLDAVPPQTYQFTSNSGGDFSGYWYQFYTDVNGNSMYDASTDVMATCLDSIVRNGGTWDLSWRFISDGTPDPGKTGFYFDDIQVLAIEKPSPVNVSKEGLSLGLEEDEVHALPGDTVRLVLRSDNIGWTPDVVDYKARVLFEGQPVEWSTDWGPSDNLEDVPLGALKGRDIPINVTLPSEWDLPEGVDRSILAGSTVVLNVTMTSQNSGKQYYVKGCIFVDAVRGELGLECTPGGTLQPGDSGEYFLTVSYVTNGVKPMNVTFESDIPDTITVSLATNLLEVMPYQNGSHIIKTLVETYPHTWAGDYEIVYTARGTDPNEKVPEPDYVNSTVLTVTVAQEHGIDLVPVAGQELETALDPNSVEVVDGHVEKWYELTLLNYGNGLDNVTLQGLSPKGWEVLFFEDDGGSPDGYPAAVFPLPPAPDIGRTWDEVPDPATLAVWALVEIPFDDLAGAESGDEEELVFTARSEGGTTVEVPEVEAKVVIVKPDPAFVNAPPSVEVLGGSDSGEGAGTTGYPGGADLQLSVDIKNLGDSVADGAFVELAVYAEDVEPPTAVHTDSVELGDLDPGMTTTVAFSWTPPLLDHGANYTLEVVIDPDDVVFENDETEDSNLLVWTIYVAGEGGGEKPDDPEGPADDGDLEVVDLGVEVTGPEEVSVEQGGSVQVVFEVRNEGMVEDTLLLLLEHGDFPGEARLEGADELTLGADGTGTVTVVIEPGEDTAAGIYSVTLMATSQLAVLRGWDVSDDASVVVRVTAGDAAPAPGPTGGGEVGGQAGFSMAQMAAIIAAITTGAVITATSPWWYLALLFLMAPLMVKYRKKDDEDETWRTRIYATIVGKPGVHFSLLKEWLEISNGTLVYNLEILIKDGRISAKRDGLYKRYFPVDTTPFRKPPEFVNMDDKIAMIVRDNPGSAQSEMAHLLDESRQKVRYHVVRMEGQGVLNSRPGPDGHPRYYIAQGSPPAQEKMLLLTGKKAGVMVDAEVSSPPQAKPVSVGKGEKAGTA